MKYTGLYYYAFVIFKIFHLFPNSSGFLKVGHFVEETKVKVIT